MLLLPKYKTGHCICMYTCAFSGTFNRTYSTAVSLIDWYSWAIQNRQGRINNMTVLEYH